MFNEGILFCPNRYYLFLAVHHSTASSPTKTHTFTTKTIAVTLIFGRGLEKHK